jgi:hypothetical protein
MNLFDFMRIVDEKKKSNPFWFEDESDSKADQNQILDAETRLGVKLPHKYMDFVKTFGGGYFAFTNIFSVNSNGEWFIVGKNEEARNYLPDDFIAISDDEVGGMYGYVVHGGVCGEEVYCWDNDSCSVSEKMYGDLFEYIVAVGLSN